MTTHIAAPAQAASDPPLARLTATASLAHAADQIALAALPLAAVTALSGGAALSGALVAAQTAAWLIVSLPGGVAVDRFGAQRVLRLALSLLAIGAGAATFAILAGFALPLGLAAFVAGAGITLYALSQVAMTARLVAPATLPTVNARLELGRVTAVTLAPAAAGLLAAHGMTSALFALAFLSALGALVAGFGLRAASAPSAFERPPILAAIAEGARFVVAEPILRAIALCAVFWNLAFMALIATFLPFALKVLQTSPAAAGLALGASGVGMILGAAIAPTLFRKVEPRVILLFGPCVSALAGLMLVASAGFGGPALCGAAIFLIGFGPMLWLVMQTSLRQIVTPPALMGRVTATIQTMIYGVRPIGALLGGFVGEAFGLPAAIELVAVLFTASALAAILSPFTALKRMPQPA